MTPSRAQITALLAAGAVAAGAVVAGAAAMTRPSQRSALVIDAAIARDGRDLVPPRLRDTRAEVRLPRTAAEAETDVRYFAAQGYRIVVAGPAATAAATSTGTVAASAGDLRSALATAAR
jgi:hypothetical protein